MLSRTFLLALFSVTVLTSAPKQVHWVATWAVPASPQLATEAERSKAHLELDNQTIREIVHVSIGGNAIRLRLSNQFGKEPVDIGAVHVAVCGDGAATIAGSDHSVTFGGRSAFTIPSNAPFLSDPVELKIPAAGNLCISLFVPKKTSAAGIHYDSHQNSYLASGDLTASANLSDAIAVNAWLFLAGVDVAAPESAAAVVTLGDSITDGAHSTMNVNHRWPNILASQLLAHHRDIGVVNAGIDGNRILHDATRIVFGVNALARFGRDVLDEPGVKYVIVLEGINDLGHAGTSAPASEAVTADDLIAGLQQMIERAHEHQIKIFGGTLTPFEGASPGYYTPEKEKERERLNDWIRSSGAFDGVVDFEKAVRDPAHPTRMLPVYDSGDHLHPSDAGYKAMGEAVNLALFK